MLFIIAVNLILSCAKDVEFTSRVNDRQRNAVLNGDAGASEMAETYIPEKWPVGDMKGASEKDVASSSAGKKWEQMVNIPYDIEGFGGSVDWLGRIAEHFREDTCINFFEQDGASVPKEKQYIKFAMETIGCDEIIGMKPTSVERPQMQGLHKDCFDNDKPQLTSHYFMHILGFDNEHQRPDNSNYIQVKSKDAISINKTATRHGREGHNNTKEDSVSFSNGKFDRHSIMMWSSSFVGKITDSDDVASKEEEEEEDVEEDDEKKEDLKDVEEGDKKVEEGDKKVEEGDKKVDEDAIVKLDPRAEEVKHFTELKYAFSPEDINKINKYYGCVSIADDSKKEPESDLGPCVYDIKENGEKKVEKKCFETDAQINVYPQSNKKISITIDYNIEEAAIGQITPDSIDPDNVEIDEDEGKVVDKKDDKVVDGEEVVAPIVVPDADQDSQDTSTDGPIVNNDDNRRLQNTDDLEAWVKAIRETPESPMFVSEAVHLVQACKRAHISIAAGDEITTSTLQVCGKAKQELVGKCNKGVKSDYKLEDKQFLSKRSSAYIKVNINYIECDESDFEDEIALVGGLDWSFTISNNLNLILLSLF